jgi:large subunit ribosomal protein L24
VTVAMKIRKGDTVHILAGKDRGKQGRVIDAMPRDRKVIVENLNIVKRHTRPRPLKDSSRMSGPQLEPGGIVEKAAPLPVSRVMLVCPVCQRPTRVGVEARETTKGEGVRKVRICKRADCGQDIDR